MPQLSQRTRGTRALMIGLVLEEVQVAPTHLLGVVGGAVGGAAVGAGEAAARREVDLDVEPLCLGVEVAAGHRPGRRQPECQLQQVGIAHRRASRDPTCPSVAPRTAPLKDASRRASAVAPARAGAILDRGCARRRGVVRPGRRNGPFQPNKETGSGGWQGPPRQGADVSTHVQQRGSKSSCRHCGTSIEICTAQSGRALGYARPAGAVVWYDLAYSQAAATSCCPSIGFFCRDEHLQQWLAAQAAGGSGYRLALDEALEVGRALVRAGSRRRRGMNMPLIALASGAVRQRILSGRIAPTGGVKQTSRAWAHWPWGGSSPGMSYSCPGHRLTRSPPHVAQLAPRGRVVGAQCPSDHSDH